MTVPAVLETENGASISCLFNPPDLTFTKENTWVAGEADGKNAERLSFVGGRSGKLDLKLIFDSSIEGRTADLYVAQLLDLMKIDTQFKGNVAAGSSGRPPWIVMHWAKLHTARMVIENLKATYTRFSGTGLALRATVDIKVRQIEDDDLLGRQNPTSHTPFPRRSHQVVAGDRLESIAARYYDDPGRWRGIAEANLIEDPFVLPLGAFIQLPHPRDPTTRKGDPA